MPYEFTCADAGCTCAARWSDETPDAIVAKVAEHLKQEHRVRTISNTLATYVKTAIRET